MFCRHRVASTLSAHVTARSTPAASEGESSGSVVDWFIVPTDLAFESLLRSCKLTHGMCGERPICRKCEQASLRNRAVGRNSCRYCVCGVNAAVPSSPSTSPNKCFDSKTILRKSGGIQYHGFHANGRFSYGMQRACGMQTRQVQRVQGLQPSRMQWVRVQRGGTRPQGTAFIL